MDADSNGSVGCDVAEMDVFLRKPEGAESSGTRACLVDYCALTTKETAPVSMLYSYIY